MPEPDSFADTQPMSARVDLQILQDTWRTAPGAIPAQLVALGLLIWMIRDWPAPPWHWFVPSLGLLVVWTLVGAMQEQFRRFGIPASGYRRWRRRLLWWHAAQGSLWGVIALALLGVATPDWKLALVVAALVYSYTVMLVSVHDWAVAFTGAAPLLTMAAVRLLCEQTASATYLAAVMLLSLITCMLVTRRISQGLREGTLLRNENADLVLKLREEIDKVTQAKARAEIADRQKGEFFASASHDLRQPLHVMMLLSSALRPHVDPKQGAALLSQMQTSLGSLSTLFEKMFDVARIDAQRIDYRPQACQLAPLWARLDAEFGVLCAHKGLRWHLVPTSACGLTDPHVLERILRNLLNNAVRYTAAGEVRLRARARGPWVVCQVWDTGVGVPKAFRHRIFEDYFQGHNDGRHSSEGLGLGLAVVRRLSQLGPTPVTLLSRPGRGSCFSVRLPRLVPAAVMPAFVAPAGATATRQAQPHSNAAHAARGVVVLIEDDPLVRESTALFLKQHGWYSAAASTPDGALTALLGLQEQGLMPEGDMPVAAISDHRLGLSINGLQALQQMRHEFGEALPAFLLTGEAGPGLAQAAQDAGVQLLHKPLQADHLIHLLEASMSAAPRRGQTDAA